jgi:hypothetical protein
MIYCPGTGEILNLTDIAFDETFISTVAYTQPLLFAGGLTYQLPCHPSFPAPDDLKHTSERLVVADNNNVPGHPADTTQDIHVPFAEEPILELYKTPFLKTSTLNSSIITQFLLIQVTQTALLMTIHPTHLKWNRSIMI